MTSLGGDTRSGTVLAGSGLGVGDDWQVALEAALDGALGPLMGEAPDLLVLFAGAAFDESYGGILAQAAARSGAREVVGCSASGVIAWRARAGRRAWRGGARAAAAGWVAAARAARPARGSRGSRRLAGAFGTRGECLHGPDPVGGPVHDRHSRAHWRPGTRLSGYDHRGWHGDRSAGRAADVRLLRF